MGGIITDAIILHLINTFARVIICGQISQYEGHLDNPQVRTCRVCAVSCVSCRAVSRSLPSWPDRSSSSFQLGPRFLHRILYTRATIQGILARDYSDRMDEMLQQMVPWLSEGALLLLLLLLLFFAFFSSSD